MPSAKEMSVKLRVDGKALQEYDTRTAEDGSAECYVASEEGKLFEVEMLNSSNTLSLACQIFLDGSRASGRLCDPSSQPVLSKGVRVSASTYRPFSFARLQLTDDERVASQSSQDWASIGTIEVRVHRIVAKYGEVPVISLKPLTLSDKPVHEQSKKAGTHRIALGQEVPKKPNHRALVKYLDPKSRPYTTIRFRYRPIALLQAQGIAPPPDRIRDIHGKRKAAEEPSPTGHGHRGPRPRLSSAPAEGGDDITSLIEDSDEVAEIEAQIRRLQEKVAQKKKADRAVKREASPIRVPPAGSTSRIVIDITDDP